MFGNKVLDESIRANVDTEVEETFGIQDARAMFRSECGAGVDHMLRHITGSLCWLMPLERMEVLDTLRSSPAKVRPLTGLK